MKLPQNYNRLTWQERRAVRLEYIARQGGKCQHCNGDLSAPPPASITNKRINRRLFPETFFAHPVHLHHDHGTGLTIGAVHNYCNAVLWQYYGE